jgi:hypothetical protein
LEHRPVSESSRLSMEQPTAGASVATSSHCTSCPG